LGTLWSWLLVGAVSGSSALERRRFAAGLGTKDRLEDHSLAVFGGANNTATVCPFWLQAPKSSKVWSKSLDDRSKGWFTLCTTDPDLTSAFAELSIEKEIQT